MTVSSFARCFGNVKVTARLLAGAMAFVFVVFGTMKEGAFDRRGVAAAVLVSTGFRSENTEREVYHLVPVHNDSVVISY